MQEMMIDLVATGWFWIGVGLYVLGMYLAAPTAWGIFGAMIDDPISIPKVETSINRVALHVYWGAAVVLIVVALALRCIATRRSTVSGLQSGMSP